MFLFKADFLNDHCHCSTLDKSKLEHPQYFSRHPHFISHSNLTQIESFIQAYERMLALPKVRERFLNSAEITEKGIFNSYDFHITDTGPQLIEINSNAAGAVLGLFAADKMQSCCDAMDGYEARQGFRFSAEKLVAMFRSEFAQRFPARPLKTVAIVDENPQGQFFYPEFLLVQKLLQEHGIEAVIVSPEDLAIRNAVAYAEEIPIDFIYNRTTDFYFERENSRVLKEIYEQGLASVSPNPAVHALYANKANLTAFWSGLAATLPAADLAIVRAHLPETIFVTAENAGELWARKKEWFFKPVGSFGGKGVYRGDKLTTKVWEHIKSGGYIAQKFVAPRERRVAAATKLKYDVRVYTYGNQILGLMARYYQGQTTNFRTEHGGLASVLVAA